MRKPAVVLIGLLVAMLCFGAVANAGIINPTKVSVSVSSKKTKTGYKFTTKGTITYPSLYCAPGTTNPAYCVPVTAAAVCNGKVSLTVKLGKDKLLAKSGKKIKSTTGKVKSNCTYSITTKFKKSIFRAKSRYQRGQKGATVSVKFSVKFLGNTYLNAMSAGTKTKGAKLFQP